MCSLKGSKITTNGIRVAPIISTPVYIRGNKIYMISLENKFPLFKGILKKTFLELLGQFKDICESHKNSTLINSTLNTKE